MRVNLNVKPSLTLLFIMLILHGLSCFAVFDSSLNIYGQMSAMLMILFSLSHYLWCLKYRSVYAITATYEQAWQLSKANGELLSGTLLGDSFITPLFCVLRFKVAGQRRAENIVLLPDSLGSKQYQLLLRHINFGVKRDREGYR